MQVGDYAYITDNNDYRFDNGSYHQITEAGNTYHTENGDSFVGIGVAMGDNVYLFDRNTGFGKLIRHEDNSIYNYNWFLIMRYARKTIEIQCKDCKCLCLKETEQGAKKYYCELTKKKAHRKDKACNKFIHKFSE